MKRLSNVFEERVTTRRSTAVRSRTILLALVAAAIVWLAIPSPVVAQPAHAEPTGSDGTNDGRTFREQTIYIPYDRLEKVFEQKGRGVFIPYEEFQALWNAARQRSVTPRDDGPPVAAVITAIDSEATAGDDVMEVTATLKIELLADGWQRIPLRLGDAAIRSATINGQAARIVTGDNGYELLIRRTVNSKTKGDDDDEAKEPGPPNPAVPTDEDATDEDGTDEDTTDPDSQSVELTLVYAKAISKSPGHNSVTVQAPQAPVNRWRIRIPEDGVKIDVQPVIAATESTQATNGEPSDPSEEETVLLAFVGSAPQVRIDWNPRAEGASGLAALLSAEAHQQVYVDEGVVRSRTILQYQVRRAELSRLQIEVPADHKVAGVFDQNIRQWEVKEGEGVQRIEVQLFEPARDTQNVTIDLEKFTAEELAEVEVPRIVAVGVGRQQGTVLVSVTDTLRSKSTTADGLVQLDADEIPQALRERQWDYAYKYSALPFSLAFSLDKIEPRISADELAEVYLEANRLLVDWTLLMNIEKAGIFQVRINLPAGYEVRQVQGRECSGAMALPLDGTRIEGEGTDAPVLVVNLTRKAIGKVALLIGLEKSLNAPELLQPTGESAQLPIEVPSIATAVERTSGRLLVRSPESLRISSGEVDGLKSDSLNEVFTVIPSAEGGRYPEARPALAFSYGSGAKSLTLNAQRRKPQVEARQLLKVAVESGLTTFTATFTYDIRYSPVESLRIDLPTEVADMARNESVGIRDEAVDNAEDLQQGYSAWQFSGDRELFGLQQIVLTWQLPMDDLAVGEPFDIAIPRLVPHNVDRSWGQIVATRDETIDVRPLPDLDGLRIIDPQHDLMDSITVENATRAFEFQQDDWQLNLQATRYDLVELKRASVDRAWFRVVVTTAGELDIQALLRMRSSQQRVAIRFPKNVDPEQSFDSQPLRINGVVTNLERGEDDLFYIPIPLRTGDPHAPLVVELRYTAEGDARSLELPEFPGNPAIGKVNMTVHIPDHLAVVMQSGDWSDDNYNPWVEAVAGYGAMYRLGVPTDDSELWEEISKGIPVSYDPTESFEVLGTPYQFSVLRPASGEEGALHLRVVSRRSINLLLFLLVAVLAIVAFRRQLPSVVTMMGCLAIAAIVIGVFWPSLARHLLDAKMTLAFIVIVVAWGMGAARRVRFNFRGPAASDGNSQDGSEQTTVESETDPAEDSPSSEGISLIDDSSSGPSSEDDEENQS